MDRSTGMLKTLLLTALLSGAGLLAGATPARAQMITRPYLAAYVGQARTDFALGDGQQDLDWRRASSVELGFDMFGMTVSPGFTGIDRAHWVVNGQDLYLQYRSIYVNLGTREPNGLYFAGGLNYTLWDEMPSQFIGGDPYVLSADSEVGFQAYLGFQVSMERLPLRVVVEAGYAQFNGNVTGTGAGEPLSSTVSSTGPIIRLGLVLARPPR